MSAILFYFKRVPDDNDKFAEYNSIFVRFLQSIYSNGFAFDCFPDKNVFDHVREYRVDLHSLIMLNLYSSPEDRLKYPDVAEPVVPLRLESICRLVIKSSLNPLDKMTIAQLPLPRKLKEFLGEGLVDGLPDSHARREMKRKYNL